MFAENGGFLITNQETLDLVVNWEAPRGKRLLVGST